MATNKKYYYLKLKDNFYESEQLIILQNMQDGYLYSDILMKLYLRSLKTEGKLMFNDLIPYTPSILAQIVRHQVGTVEKALKIFKELGLIEILDNGAIYMMDIQNFIGKSSSEGDRKREYRSKIQKEKTNLLGQMSDKRPPEIEIEIERDIEKEIEIEIKKDIMSSEKSHDHAAAKEIIDYLNLKTGKHFKYTKNNINKIKTRLKENFTLDDFKIVIDKKTYEWLNDDKMNQYLRPETLFGSKFESYLQQEVKKKSLKDLNIEEIKLMKGDDYGKNTVCRANENIDYGIF
jgi:predicted phage replisome organizer/uncharacterized phage protein (TIGR02220 family)